jgi:uncharacterized repeat protein (TIGR03803 family)
VGLLIGFVSPSAVQAQSTEKILFSFDRTDGGLPFSALLLDAQGNIYGTTLVGGTFDSGVVFKVPPSGGEKIIYNFKWKDGSGPTGLIHDTAGNLYGACASGGTLGAGSVFKIDKTGKETVLHSFRGSPNDGEAPQAGLVRDTADNLYGTTASGGAYGFGTIFKINPRGGETVLYSFTGGADGAYPYSGLILDAAGNLYGTTAYGGPYGSGTAGFGTVFKLDPSRHETVLYAFLGGADGAYSFGGLIRDSSGKLYGSTNNGGSASGCDTQFECGTVFEVDTSGKETVLHSFGSAGDGKGPQGNLILDEAHNLYGATFDGGTLQSGTVFKLDPSGNETVLYNFGTNPGDGGLPRAGLVRDAAGNLYGTTEGGGCCGGYGIVFELTFP